MLQHFGKHIATCRNLTEAMFDVIHIIHHYLYWGRAMRLLMNFPEHIQNNWWFKDKTCKICKNSTLALDLVLPSHVFHHTWGPIPEKGTAWPKNRTRLFVRNHVPHSIPNPQQNDLDANLNFFCIGLSTVQTLLLPKSGAFQPAMVKAKTTQD